MKKTSAQVRKIVADLIRKSGGVCHGDLDHFAEHGLLAVYVTFGDEDIIWGHQCSVMVDTKCQPHLSWSSTGRSPAMARAILKVYAQACDLADLIQAVLDCTEIVDETK